MISVLAAHLALATVATSAIFVCALAVRRCVSLDVVIRYQLGIVALVGAALAVPLQLAATTSAPPGLRSRAPLIAAASTDPKPRQLVPEIAGVGTGSSSSGPAAVSTPISQRTLWPAVLALYSVGVAAHIALLVIRITRTHRLVRQSRPVTDPAVLAVFARAARETGVHGARLVISADVTTPASWRWRVPTVLVPESMPGRAAVRCAMVHELVHLRRHDSAVSVLQRIVTACCWFNPIAWRFGAVLEGDREMSCDALVVRSLGSPHDYAHALLEFAAAASPRPRTLLTGFASPASPATHAPLDRRFEMIERLQTEPAPGPRRGPMITATAVAAAALLLVAHGALTAIAAPQHRTQADGAATVLEIVAPKEGRSPADVLDHLTLVSRHYGRGLSFAPGSNYISQETLVAGVGAHMADDRRIVGNLFHLNLPEGSKMRAEITGTHVQLDPQPDQTRIVIEDGVVRLVDETGVVRVSARVAGEGTLHAELHLTEEISLLTTAVRPNGRIAPVEVTIDTDTGRIDDDAHGVTRFVLLEPNEPNGEPIRVKIQWVYELDQLQREAGKE